MTEETVITLDEQLLSPDFFVDPYPVYARLRSEDPVHWSKDWNCWVISRYSDVLACMRQDGRKFLASGRFGSSVEMLPEKIRADYDPIKQHYSVGLLHSDPPDHTRLRSVLNKALTPQVIEEMRPRIEVIANDLLDKVQDTGKMEVISDFASPLPSIVTLDLIGLPLEDREQLKEWAYEISTFSAANRLTVDIAERSQRNLLQAREYLESVAAKRLNEPRDDIISRLVGVETQDGGVSMGELLSTTVTFLNGGHTTTASLISSGLFALFQNPDQLRKLQDNPSSVPMAVEEFLRYDAPNQRTTRTVKEDIEIGNNTIQQGQTIMMLIGSANRDSEQFTDPDSLDIDRKPNRHLSFAMGPHFCIGASLARLEAEIAFNTMLRRFPNMQLEHDELEWQSDAQIRSLKSLPVVF